MCVKITLVRREINISLRALSVKYPIVAEADRWWQLERSFEKHVAPTDSRFPCYDRRRANRRLSDFLNGTRFPRDHTHAYVRIADNFVVCIRTPRLHTCPTYALSLITRRRSRLLQTPRYLSRIYMPRSAEPHRHAYTHFASVTISSSPPFLPSRTCNANKIRLSSHIRIGGSRISYFIS